MADKKMIFQKHTSQDVERLRKTQPDNVAPHWEQDEGFRSYPKIPVAIGDFVRSEYYGNINATRYSLEADECGLDPWRDIEPEEATDGSGVFLSWNSENPVPHNFIIYVWKSEVERFDARAAAR